MSRTRAGLRAVAIVATTIRTIGSLLLIHGRHAARPAARALEADRIGRRWAHAVRRRIGMRLLVEGEPPEGPVALVANHLGYLDIVALWCVVPGAFVARADVSRWPLIGVASRLIGTIPIDRGRKRDLLRVLPELSRALAAGRNVIFFPEATSSPGEALLPFRSPLFEAAVRRAVPVVAVSIQYETGSRAELAATRLCWWGDMPFVQHVLALLRLPRFDARLRFSHPIPATKDRKELCRLARDSVSKTFVPTAPAGFSIDHGRAAGRPSR